MAVSGESSPGSENRQSTRFRYIGVIFLSWIEAGDENHVMGRCLDISVGGLGVEVTKRIPVDTEVRVLAGWVNLDGAATVRHIVRRGGVFHLGLQLKQPLLPEILAQVVAPDAE